MYSVCSGKYDTKRFRCGMLIFPARLPQCPFRYIEYIHDCTDNGHAPDQEHKDAVRTVRGVSESPDLRREPGAEFVGHYDYF